MPDGAAYVLYVFWDGTHVLSGDDEAMPEWVADDLIRFASKMRQPERLDGVERFSELHERKPDE